MDLLLGSFLVIWTLLVDEWELKLILKLEIVDLDISWVPWA